MPLNLSFTHMMVVAFVALVVLGPDRLPGVARTAGNLYREWKRISGGLQAEVRDVLGEFTEPFTEPISDLLHGAPDEGRGRMAEATAVAAGVTAVAAVAAAGAAPAAPPLASLPPLDTPLPPSSSTPAPGSGAVVVPPLSPAMPALGPGTGLMSPGPAFAPRLPDLGPPPQPGTFVPFTPAAPGGHD